MIPDKIRMYLALMQDIFGAKNSAEFRKEVDVFTQNEKIQDYVITYKSIQGEKKSTVTGGT